MKRMSRVLATGLATLMMVGMMAGCQGSQQTSAGTSSAATTAAASGTTAANATTTEANPYADHLDISIAYWRMGEALPENTDDAIRDQIFEKFNMTIDPINLTWDDYTQKILTWAASDQLPDVFGYAAVGTSTYADWIDQSIIQALPDDLSAYPNIQSIIESDGSAQYKYPMGSADGKFYAVPRLQVKASDDLCLSNGTWIRSDWMAKVGVTEAPANMDEFIDLMVKFAKEDPDGDGQDNTMGLTCYDASWLQFMLLQYQPAAIDPWVKGDDGQWTPTFMTDGYRQGILKLKELFTKGGLDPDFATLKGEEGEDKFANNRAGAYTHDDSPSTLGYIGDKFKEANGASMEDSVMLLKPFKSTDGNYYRRTGNISWSETYFNAKADAAKVDRILAFQNWLLSDEGYTLIHFGIEGTDYTRNGDSLEVIQSKDSSGEVVNKDTVYPIMKVNNFAEWSGTHMWSSVTPKYPKFNTMTKELYDWYLKNAIPAKTDARTAFVTLASRSKETFNAKDFIIKCVVSDDTEAAYQEQVANFKANGYDDLIKEMNTAMSALKD
ncbi:MAG: hypothetical protein VB070_07895 [Clostridiaceae bacterium]|nr:hypothetical protein [Clostridiaceae bacterium]